MREDGQCQHIIDEANRYATETVGDPACPLNSKKSVIFEIFVHCDLKSISGLS